MKKSIRYITLLLAAVFLIAGTSLIAYADNGLSSGSAPADDGGEAVADDGGEIDPGVDPGEDPGGNSADSGNSGNSGGNSADSGNSGNAGDNQTVDNGGSNDTPVDNNQTPAADDGYVDSSAQDSGYDSGYDDNQNDGGDSYNSDNATPQYQYIDDSPLYYGDAQNYDYNSSSDNDRNAGKIDTQLYPAEVDKSIKAQKWENLEIPGTNKDVKLNSGSADGDVSFASMKSSNGSGDDMAYIPYLGIALVAMAVLGILYFIIATVSGRKALATATASNGNSDKNAAAPAARKSKKSGKNLRYADDYDDGYSATRRGSKADTAEIHLPRRFK